MMAQLKRRPPLSRFLSEYRMVLVLLGLCAFFSYATLAEQRPTGADAGRRLADEVVRKAGAGARVLIVARASAADGDFADALAAQLARSGVKDVATLRGKPADVREALGRFAGAGRQFDVVAANQTVAA